MMGWVYVLRHRCMPGLLKIGWTSRTVGVRKKELEAPTGVPGPFEVAWQMPVYGIAVEREVHRRLHRWREIGNREFFRCSLLRAKLVIWSANRDYAREVVGQGCWNPLPLLWVPRKPAQAVRKPVRRGRGRSGGWRRPERAIIAVAVCVALLVTLERPSLGWVPDGTVKRMAVRLEGF